MKSDIIGKTVTVTVDRPLGSHHPVYKKLYYPVNYGYIQGIMAPDGEEQDAYILGVDTPVEVFTGAYSDDTRSAIPMIPVHLHGRVFIIVGKINTFFSNSRL